MSVFSRLLCRHHYVKAGDYIKSVDPLEELAVIAHVEVCTKCDKTRELLEDW